MFSLLQMAFSAELFADPDWPPGLRRFGVAGLLLDKLA
jgi:hypothetical protein